MKQTLIDNVNINEMEEFEKEVTMMDKFRSDYIVHFYGAVFIENCAVGGYKISKCKFKNLYPKGLRNFK